MAGYSIIWDAESTAGTIRCQMKYGRMTVDDDPVEAKEE
jgi:hypothetical protein